MIEIKDLTTIGKFQKTHALKGELNAVLDIDPEFFDSDPFLVVSIDGIFVPFRVTSIRTKGSFSYLITLSGIDSEEEAKKFVNKEIYARKHEVRVFDNNGEDEGEYADDMVGYSLIDNESGFRGEIDNIDLSTANPLFIVIDENGNEVMIPVADEFVLNIDPENRIIETNLPSGLIELNTKSDS